MEFQYIAIYNWIEIVLLFHCLLNLSPSIKCKSQNISRKGYFFWFHPAVREELPVFGRGYDCFRFDSRGYRWIWPGLSTW